MALSCGAQKAFSTKKATILPLKIRLLPVEAGAQNSGEDMGFLSEKKKINRPNDKIVAYVMHVHRIQKQFSLHNSDIIAMD